MKSSVEISEDQKTIEKIKLIFHKNTLLEDFENYLHKEYLEKEISITGKLMEDGFKLGLLCCNHTQLQYFFDGEKNVFRTEASHLKAQIGCHILIDCVNLGILDAFLEKNVSKISNEQYLQSKIALAKET